MKKLLLTLIIGIGLMVTGNAAVAVTNQQPIFLNAGGTNTVGSPTGPVINGTCPVSESTMFQDFKEEILRLLQEYNFASLRILIGGRTVTIQDDIGSPPIILNANYDPLITNTGTTYDCILNEQKVWYQLAQAGQTWNSDGILPEILHEFNGFTLSSVKDLISGGFRTSGPVQNPLFLEYSLGASDFMVTLKNNRPDDIEILTVFNQYNPKEPLSPIESVEYYAFNKNPQAQILQFAIGQVPAYGLVGSTGGIASLFAFLPTPCYENPALQCAPEFYTNISPAEMEHIFQTLYARRVIRGTETPLSIGTTFQFGLQRYDDRKIVLATVRGMDLQGHVTWLEIKLGGLQDIQLNPDFWLPIVQFLNPNCATSLEYITGTCGTEIPYCQDGNCGFQTGLEEVRTGLQESNVSTTNSLKDLIRGWINFSLGFLFLVAVVVIIVSGILMLANFGNDDFISKGKKMITYGIIGLLLILLAYPIINTIINAVQ